MFDGYRAQGMVRALETNGESSSLTTSWVYIAIDAGDGDYLQPGFFPRRCNVHRVILRLASMSTASPPSTATIGLFRTASQDYPITDPGDAAYTKPIVLGTTANTGSVLFSDLNVDHDDHQTHTVASSNDAPYDDVASYDAGSRKPWCRVFLGIKLNIGTANLADSETYWRGKDVAA